MGRQMVPLGHNELIDAWDQLFHCLYLFSVLFLSDIQAHTQTTAYYEILHSSHIQYDILCYSVILTAVL